MANYKRNYLPSQSQPWAKQVETQVDATERNLRSLDVNNRSKDEQFAASLSRLDSATRDAAIAAEAAGTAATQAGIAASDAQDAADIANGIISNIYTPGTSNIAGSKVTSGSLSGTAIASGTLGADKLVSNYVYTGSLSANQIQSGSISANFISGGTISGDIINGGTITGTTISGNSISGGSITGVTISGDTISGGTISSPNINGGNISGTEIIGGTVNCTGTGIVLQAPFGTVFGKIVNAGDWLYADGRINSSGTESATVSNAANLFIASNGNIARSTSSIRYKTDVQDLDLGMMALDLQPRTWIDKKEYEANGNSAEGLTRFPGFIAEELHDLGFTSLVVYNEEGLPEAISYDRMTVAIIPVLKQQQTLIEQLTARIEALESN
jgi:hypothetical protein